MFRKSMIALTLATVTAGAAAAQPTHTIEAWGGHFDVPDQGAGGLFGSAAAPSAEAVGVTGSIGRSAPARQGRFRDSATRPSAR